MPKLIAIDDGHGLKTPGKRTPLFPDGSFMPENEFNRAVTGYLMEDLERCGFDVLLTAFGGDIDVPLATRVARANNQPANIFRKQADFFISIHANALNGVWGPQNGVETYVQTGLSTSGSTYKMAKIIHKWLVSSSKRKDRGLKFSNYYVTRETNMPAVLVECGFMDNFEEAVLLRADDYRRKVATGLAKSICEMYNVTYKEINTGGGNTGNEQDVNAPSDWAKPAWNWGIQNGITDGSLPKNIPTREQVIQLIYNYSKIQPKKDMPTIFAASFEEDLIYYNSAINTPSDWAKPAWNWGIQNGITDGSFPRNTPTREQVVQLIYNYHIS